MASKIPLNRKVATQVIKRQDLTAVKFHDTEIVRFDAEIIRLDSNEWQTVTTKRRMNQTSAAYNLAFGVFQKRGAWFVFFMDENFNHSEPIPFYDGIVLSRNRAEPHPSEHREPGETGGFNGWPNRATWNCFLWLNNVESSYRRYLDQARRQPFTMNSARHFVLRLWDYRSIFDARTPDGLPLGRVHFDRIAAAMNEAAQP